MQYRLVHSMDKVNELAADGWTLDTAYFDGFRQAFVMKKAV